MDKVDIRRKGGVRRGGNDFQISNRVPLDHFPGLHRSILLIAWEDGHDRYMNISHLHFNV